MTDITLLRYNHETQKTEEVGKVNSYDLTRSISSEELTEILSDYLNLGGKDFQHGKRIGKMAQREHRTLQGLLVRFCLGIIVGLSEQEYTDARNEKVVALGKKLAKMLDDGELDMGYMI